MRPKEIALKDIIDLTDIPSSTPMEPTTVLRRLFKPRSEYQAQGTPPDAQEVDYGQVSAHCATPTNDMVGASSNDTRVLHECVEAPQALDDGCTPEFRDPVYDLFIEVACPRCGEHSYQIIAWVKAYPDELMCAACERSFLRDSLGPLGRSGMKVLTPRTRN
ncbi:MAG: hypothetical protein AB7P42_18085 [Gammaproteobacteria bacterium]